MYLCRGCRSNSLLLQVAPKKALGQNRNSVVCKTITQS
eukprot:UN00424